MAEAVRHDNTLSTAIAERIFDGFDDLSKSQKRYLVYIVDVVLAKHDKPPSRFIDHLADAFGMPFIRNGKGSASEPDFGILEDHIMVTRDFIEVEKSLPGIPGLNGKSHE